MGMARRKVLAFFGVQHFKVFAIFGHFDVTAQGFVIGAIDIRHTHQLKSCSFQW